MIKSELDIQFFLYLGYFPRYSKKVHLDYLHIDRDHYSKFGRDALLNESSRLFRQVVAREFHSSQKNVVPISGGLDSRALLAALLELTEAKNIRTYTFGTPGTYDYDLGCAVAARAGTKHTAIPLDQLKWRDQDFLEAAKRFDFQTFLFHHAPPRKLEKFSDGVIWSGYIGDVVTGAHLKKDPSENLIEAKYRYLEKRREARSIKIVRCTPEDVFPLIGGGELAPEVMTFDEQVFFSEMGAITEPHVLMDGFEYKTPFINNEFYNFFLSIPPQYRIKQNLFIESMQRTYPDLFAMPTKSRYGLRLKSNGTEIFVRRARNKLWNIGQNTFRSFDWPALPMTNFFDVNLSLRKNPSLQKIVRAHLTDLKQRQIVPWIDIDNIWQRHMKRQGQHGDVIKILFSLEVNLKGLEKMNSEKALR